MKNFSPEKVLLGLISAELILIALFGLGGFGLRHDFFHLGREKNLPTWFSSIQLFFVAYSAIIIANKESFIEGQGRIITNQLFWYVIAAGFTFLSLDEFVEIHELITRRGRTPYWVLVYIPIAFLVACYSCYEAVQRRRIYPQLPYYFCASFFVMGAGAFGAEWAGIYMPSKTFYGIALVVEEFCEMLGVSILIYGILRYSQVLDRIHSTAAHGQPPAHEVFPH
jgi:hypothetical protein